MSDKIQFVEQPAKDGVMFVAKRGLGCVLAADERGETRIE
jgi:hypothetical protein